MASKLTTDAFLRVIKQSDLLTTDQLTKAIEGLKTAGLDLSKSDLVAEGLVNTGLITGWQAEKLLQGKHKGFFLGKYRLLSLLGKGGMSSVYLAEHILMRRRCAIKVLPSKRVHDSSYLARFHREAQAVASLDHPNIVRAYDVDHETSNETEIHFLVMEYVDGQSLQELIREEGTLSLEDAVEYCRQTALGLEHAHRAGMVHRDIKPGNILVDKNGLVKLLDLGLARFFDDEDKESLTVAHDEKVLGTADYLAPEQALDSHHVDARADIYSLGCTMYYLLTGHPPFVDGTLAQRLMSHQNKVPPPITDDRPDIPESLQRIIEKMMMKDPAQRYESADALAQVMADWLGSNASSSWKSDHPGATSGELPPSADSSSSEVPTPSHDDNLNAFLANLNQSSPPKNSVPRETSANEQRPISDKTAPVKAKPLKAKPVALSTDEKPAATKVKRAVAKVKPSKHTSDTSSIRSSKTNTKTGINQRPEVSADNPFVGGFPVIEPSKTTNSGKIQIDTNAPDFEDAAATNEEETVSKEDHQTESSSQISESPNVTQFTKLFISRQRLIGGVGVVALLAIVLLWFFGGEKGPGPVKKKGPLPPISGEVTVGPGESFEDISTVLQHALQTFESTGPNDILKITVKPGTYTGQLTFAGSGGKVLENIHLIAGEGGRVILKSTGKDPVIKYRAGNNIQINGFEIDASGKPTALELEGRADGLRLENCHIYGFTQAGIKTNSLAATQIGPQMAVISNLEMESDAKSATGILLTSDRIFTSFIHLKNITFGGDLASGITIDGPTDHLRVTDCIFSSIPKGIEFNAGVSTMYELMVVNNTFYRVRHPISFSELPPLFGNKIFMYRNLFLETGGNEVHIEDGPDLKGLADLISVRFNWSDRQPSGPPLKAGEFNLFAVGGKAGNLGITFEQLDPHTTGYLKPQGANFPPKGSYEPEFAQPHVGAVAP